MDLDSKACLAVPGAIWNSIQLFRAGREWSKGLPKITRWCCWIVAWVSVAAGIAFGVHFHWITSGGGAEGKLTVLANEGTIADLIIKRLRIYGSPAPNTKTTIIDNQGRIGRLSMEDNEVNNLSNSPIPAPEQSTTPSGLSYRIRVSQLADATAKWYQENVPQGPLTGSDVYHTYWTKKMSEYHDVIGKQILALMEQMRNCQYQEVKTIYWMEKPRPTLPAMLPLQVNHLRALKELLPEQDSQLPCVQSP
jgi:hypothetical protein